jgi:tetratricopeptide (TPR) repeat protein
MATSDRAALTNATFQRADAFYRQGDVAQATRSCEDTLRLDPQYFPAYHLLGVSALNQGDVQRAISLIARSLAINPNQPLAHANLGNAWLGAGEPQRALDCFDQAIALNPNLSAARYGRACALRTLNRLDEALAAYEAVLESNPAHAMALNDRGWILRQLGRSEEAVRSFEQAFRADPGFVRALQNLTAILLEMGRPLDSLDVVERLQACAPKDTETLYSRGRALMALERCDAAFECFEKLLQLDPLHTRALFEMGNIWQQRLRPEIALKSYDRAIAARADFAEAHSNRGVALQELNRLTEAQASYDRAIALNSRFAEAHCNRGALLARQNQPQAALESFDRAITIKPDFAVAHFRRAQALLSIGNFASGWSEYEWRLHEEGEGTARSPAPRWQGHESLAEKRILLLSEQGLGDTIQFCRYVSLVADLGAQVILSAPRTLASLLMRLPGVIACTAPGEALPPHDYYLPMMSLPLVFGTTVETIPARVPYLMSDRERLCRMQARLGERTKPRVGLVWSGGFRPNEPNVRAVNERRNILLTTVLRLLSPGIEFHSLQKGEPAESELASLRACSEAARSIHVHAGELQDFADTAALIEQLDLVISVDTAVAHLTGAIGRPVWLMNRFDTCWRWFIERTDSPWYPTMRVYRQQKTGDWDSVVESVRADLAELGA